jgi:hypothetical protein
MRTAGGKRFDVLEGFNAGTRTRTDMSVTSPDFESGKNLNLYLALSTVYSHFPAVKRASLVRVAPYNQGWNF